MPAVFTFWQTPEDERIFSEFIQSTGEIVGWPDKAIEEAQTDKFPLGLMDLLALKRERSICITRREFCVNRNPRSVTREGKRRVQMMVAEVDDVIVFQRPPKIKRTLGRTNLVAYWTPFTVEDAPKAKSKEFVAWGKKVFRWVRSTATCKYRIGNYDYPATPGAKAAFETGEFVAGW